MARITKTDTLESKAKVAYMRAFVAYEAASKLYLSVLNDERIEKDYREALGTWIGVKQALYTELDILSYDDIKQIETDLAWDR